MKTSKLIPFREESPICKGRIGGSDQLLLAQSDHGRQFAIILKSALAASVTRTYAKFILDFLIYNRK